MSKLTVDFNPLLKKVQTDISFLCYLGLHQYAKENQLIGRSRPMITPNLDFTKQKRLNFRLMVACLQQIIGSKTMEHRGRVEQINYVNVQKYSTLRLYGLFDLDMFAVHTEKDKCLTGYWPQQVNPIDIDILRGKEPLKEIEHDLGYQTRAMLEVGGDIFAEKLRAALRLIPREIDGFTPHQQRDPRNRMSVKSIAIQLKVIEHRYFAKQRLGLGIPSNSNNLYIPTHIEQLLHFRHILWPWIQSLQNEETRDTFTYIAQNWPSIHAVQMKTRYIRDSAAERERLRRQRQEAYEQREADRQQLRERLLAIYGDRQDTEPVYRMGEAEPVEHVPVTREHEPEEIIPFADLHVGEYEATHQEIQTRIARALGLTEAEDDDDEEIPF